MQMKIVCYSFNSINLFKLSIQQIFSMKMLFHIIR